MKSNLNEEEASKRKPRYLNVEDAAAHIGASKQWLYAIWAEGNGPPRIRISGRIFVPIDDLDAWMGNHLVKAKG